jgi:hypothetical protein
MMVKRYGPKGSKMMGNNVKGPEARSNKELAEGEATQIKVTKEGKKKTEKKRGKRKKNMKEKGKRWKKGCVCGSTERRRQEEKNWMYSTDELIRL